MAKELPGTTHETVMDLDSWLISMVGEFLDISKK